VAAESASVRCTPSSKSAGKIRKQLPIGYDLDGADVYHALAYYHDHSREMRDLEQEREDAIEDFR
jgi:uncharacterized protein (DUF433 family)